MENKEVIAMAKKKLNSKKTIGNWNHPDCRYDVSPGKNNRRQVAGIYTDDKNYFAFSLHEQSKSEAGH